MPLEIAWIDFDLPEHESDIIIHSKIKNLNNNIKKTVILVFWKWGDNWEKKQKYSTKWSPLD